MILAVDILSLSLSLSLSRTCVYVRRRVNDQHTNTIFFVQHAQMLVVRKEGKAHDQYNSFRSAFELMETVGREPNDSFNEMVHDLPPLEMLEKKMMLQHKALLAEIHQVKDENSQMKTKISQMEAKSSQLEAKSSQLEAENIDLRCRLEKLEQLT